MITRAAGGCRQRLFIVMIFGGIQKTSMIDYPGKVSCVLFTTGCNFTCPYCHNPELASNQVERLSPLDENEILDFLKSRQGLLEGVVITGGEPTLHSGLGVFCEKVKQMGYPIKLDTNGSRPDDLQYLCGTSLVDYIAMDVKTDPSRYSPDIFSADLSRNLTSCIDSILSSGLPHEFRTTCLSPFVDTEIIGRIANYIEGADLYVLQRCTTGRVLNPDYMREKTSSWSEADLLRFQSIAAPFVKRCIVR